MTSINQSVPQFARLSDQAGAVQGAQMLGERALLLASRAPRLAEWHAEAATAHLLAQPEITEAFTAFNQLGEWGSRLPEQFKAIEALDPRLEALPAELAGALAKQPELKAALNGLEQTSQQMIGPNGAAPIGMARQPGLAPLRPGQNNWSRSGKSR